MIISIFEIRKQSSENLLSQAGERWLRFPLRSVCPKLVLGRKPLRPFRIPSAAEARRTNIGTLRYARTKDLITWRREGTRSASFTEKMCIELDLTG